MTFNKDDEIVGFFPRKRLVISFLVVTMMLTFGTGLSVITVCNIYIEPEPKTVFGALMFASIIFCLLNFQVTRGSFVCAKVLRYYSVALALICIPTLFLADIDIEQIYSVANIVMLFGAFCLMGGKTYQEFVRYQCNFFADIKEAREEVEKEMVTIKNEKNRSSKQGKVSKKR